MKYMYLEKMVKCMCVWVKICFILLVFLNRAIPFYASVSNMLIQPAVCVPLQI